MLTLEDIESLDDAARGIESGRLTKPVEDKAWEIVRANGFNAVCCATPYHASHGGCSVCGAW